MTPLSETVKQSIEIFFGSYSEPRSENFLDAEECPAGVVSYGGNEQKYACQKDVIDVHGVIMTPLFFVVNRHGAESNGQPPLKDRHHTCSS